MDIIKHHFTLFPPRLRRILEDFPDWEKIFEIRLRCGAPLSLSSMNGNVTLNESGLPCPLSQGVCAEEEEIAYVLGSFCKGSVYRYFHRLKDGFAVDDYGWRIGISTERAEQGVYFPGKILGINLRIPRQAPMAAVPIIEKMKSEGLFSMLIFSAPGEGKTTILRSLASLLSLGSDAMSPVRVAVVDERQELFPPKMKIKAGLLDVLPSYGKSEGMELAARLFSPQVIPCDEIGNHKEAEAILDSCSGGCYAVATAHSASPEEARRIPYLSKLIESGKFRYGLFIKKEAKERYQCKFLWEKFL
ncbi:MAG: hypothetical protein IJC26_08095 [Clostridia bacterium]|nr:hypothetical protein [Clostridia bacterium]